GSVGNRGGRAGVVVHRSAGHVESANLRAVDVEDRAIIDQMCDLQLSRGEASRQIKMLAEVVGQSAGGSKRPAKAGTHTNVRITSAGLMCFDSEDIGADNEVAEGYSEGALIQCVGYGRRIGWSVGSNRPTRHS